jgi:hypothetical protein
MSTSGSITLRTVAIFFWMSASHSGTTPDTIPSFGFAPRGAE